MDRVTAAQVFIDVTRSGSFTATAERLNMSRPMVTRYVEAMESWFGVRLLHRTTRKIALTTIGEQCLQEIEPWFDSAEQLVANINSANELTGTIKVAASMSFAHAQLMPAISRFLHLHPKVNIDIELQDNTIDLVKHRIDLAIRIAANPEPSLIGKPIAVCRSVMVANKGYLKTMPEIEKPEDLTKHHCLSYSNFERQVWHLSQGQQHKSIAINCRLSANEATALFQATQAGAGVSILPTYLARAAIAKGDLVEILPQWQVNKMNIYALYSSRKYLAPAVRALIDFLSEYFQSHLWDS